MLTDAQIQKFKELYFKNFGIQLNDDQAFEVGQKVINLIKTMKIDPPLCGNEKTNNTKKLKNILKMN